jgi:hypothetical protein
VSFSYEVSGIGGYVEAASANIRLLNVYNNSASAKQIFGGGFYLSTTASATITDSQFHDNVLSPQSDQSSNLFGGGLYLAGQNIQLTNASFFSNSLTGTYVEGGMFFSRLFFLISIFYFLTQISPLAGGLRTAASNATFSQCSAYGNSITASEGKGGGFFLFGSSDFFDWEIHDNTLSCGSCKGGGFCIESPRAIITDGVTALAAFPTHMTNLLLRGNSAGGSSAGKGGGGYISSIFVEMSDIEIFENSVSGQNGATGAGLCIENGQASITDVSVYNNTATGQVGTGGGIAAMALSKLTILRAEIFNNTASVSGGGFSESQSDATMQDSEIYNNRASRSNGGGAQVSNSTFANVTIYGNTANLGGGVYIGENLRTNITNCWIRANQATAEGGGVYLAAQSRVMMFFNRIEQNLAPVGAGAALYGQSATLNRDQVIANSATESAGGLKIGGITTGIGISVAGNTAPNGGGVMGLNSFVFLEDSTIEDNIATIG